jgi:8-oxo-dGTP pyrophosphatase MutT (NUDIX family)
MGSVNASDEPALEAAKRELQEETGLAADEWHEIGRFAPMSGLCSEVALVYIARGIQAAGEARPDGNEGIEDAVQWLPLDDAVSEMMKNREVVDAQSAAAIAMATVWLRKN